MAGPMSNVDADGDPNAKPIGFFVPITAKDRRVGRDALGRLAGIVDDVIEQSGIDEDELIREVAPKRRSR